MPNDPPETVRHDSPREEPWRDPDKHPNRWYEGRVDPDVLLDVPVLKVEAINLNVEDLRARVSLETAILDLLRLHVGVDATLGKVSLDIAGVEAKALLKVRLDNVAMIVREVLRTIDNNPQIIENITLGARTAIQDVGRATGGAVGDLGRSTGLTLGGAASAAGDTLGGVASAAGETVRSTTGAPGRPVPPEPETMTAATQPGEPRRPGEAEREPERGEDQRPADETRAEGQEPEAEQPEGEEKKPEGEAEQPEGEKEKPEGEAEQPEGEKEKPEGEAEQPEGERAADEETDGREGGEPGNEGHDLGAALVALGQAAGRAGMRLWREMRSGQGRD